MQYRRHPISSAFPDLSNEDLNDLRLSIQAVGVLNPITLYDGMVLDGWQRYCVARQLGVPCPTKRFQGTRQQAVRHAVASQVRRNMTKMDRALVLIALLSGQLATRGKKSKSATSADLTTLAELAASSGIGERTLARAKRITDLANPSLRIVLAKGLISIGEAERIASLSLEDQKWDLRHTLKMRELRTKPFDIRGFLHENGHWVTISERQLEFGREIRQKGITAVKDLLGQGKLGIIAAVALARRPAEEQRHVIESASWIKTLRIPRVESRWSRKMVRKDPFYFLS